MNPFRNRNGHSINGDLISRLTKKYGSLLRPCARARACVRCSGNEFLFLSSATYIIFNIAQRNDVQRKRQRIFHHQSFFHIAIEYSGSKTCMPSSSTVRPINHSTKFHYPTRNSSETKKGHGGKEGRQDISARNFLMFED